jgi:hypothetical protein
MKTVQIQLTDTMAQAASAAGLLTSQSIENLLDDALRQREVVNSLQVLARQVEDAGIESMSMQEINAEVKAVRSARRLQSGAIKA